MRLSIVPVGLSKLAATAVAGVTVLSVGACGSSHDGNSPATSAASSGGKAAVSGMVKSVAGGTVEVAEEAGTTTVEVGSSAKVTENAVAQLPDVVAGNCLRVAFTPESSPAPGGVVTVKAVQLLLPGSGGKCQQPKTPVVGSPDERLIGTVVGVEGSSIKVAYTDGEGNPGDTVVTVTDKTGYHKEVSLTAQGIMPNKCITAHGVKSDDGKLQAQTVTLSPASKGKCPSPPVKK